MGGALWPTELSRHGWPPRDRTAQYLRIRQAPSTSWVVASGWRRSRPQRSRALPGSSRVQSPVCLRFQERRGRESNSQGRSSTAFGADPVANRVASPWRRTEYSKPTRKEPRAFQAATAPWRLHPPWTVRAARWGPAPARPVSRRAENSNPTALPAHSLAARPGTLTGSLSVPFPGFEPGRHPSEGCGSASWPRRARTASG